MKKLLMTIAISALMAGSAFAADKSGAYVGVNAGYAKVKSGETTQYGDAISATVYRKFNRSGGGLQGGLFGGYEFNPAASDWLLGLELDASLVTAKVKASSTYNDSADVRSETLKMKKRMGATVNIGYQLNDQFTLYGRLGLVRGYFELKQKALKNQAGYTDANEKANLWGVAPGARLKMDMGHGWATNLDVVYTKFQSKQLKNFDPNTGQVWQAKIKPAMWSFLVGVSKKF